MPIKQYSKILIILVAALLCIFVWIRARQGRGSQESVKEVHASIGSIQKSVSATGNVQPQNRLEMKSPISGRVDKILVEEGQTVKTGNILAWLSSTDRAALLDAAKPQGEEALKYWEDVYKPTPIIASMDGEVIVKSVQPGQTVTPADDIVVLSDRLIVEAQVDETDIGKVKQGQKAVITLDAYPEILVEAAVGHIYYESKIVNNVTIYNVDILPEKVPDVFRSGMSANVRIIQESKDNILMVPLEAVKRPLSAQGVGKRQSEGFVFLSRGKNAKPEKRKVEIGLADENNVQIVSGIDENDTLVIRSQQPRAPSKTTQPKTNPFMPGGRR